MPRIWIDYLVVLTHPSCPAFLSHSHARHTFNRALRTLPGSLHPRIWRLYLSRFAALSPFKHQIWSRYLRVDPTPTEFFISTQLASSKDALIKAKLLLGLARSAAKGKYRSPEGKSPFHLLEDWLDVCEKHPEQVAIEMDQVPKDSLIDPDDVEEEQQVHQNQDAAANGTNGKLIRVVENGQKDGQADGEVESESLETDSRDTSKLDVERIVRREGLLKYPDQAGKLWVGLATFWINMGELDHVSVAFTFKHACYGLTRILFRLELSSKKVSAKFSPCEISAQSSMPIRNSLSPT